MAQFQVKNYAPSFYIGETSQGIESAVFHDPNFASLNNESGVSLITGAPGSGKTFFAQTLCAQSATAGKMVVVIDPKADFISMKNIEYDVGKVTLMQLSKDSRAGIIDPFVICGDNKPQGIVLAKEMIKTLTNVKDLPFEAIDPILSDVSAQENPSFRTVVNELRGFTRQSDPDLSSRVRNIGSSLNTISQMPFAKMMFSNPYNVPDRIPMKEGLTVITMLGLPLPSADKPTDEYTEPNRIAAGIMFLISDYVSSVMLEDTKGTPKLLIIDEAWAVVKNPAGSEVISQVSNMGRSLSMSMVMVTQSAGHIASLENIENTITTFFAFKANGKEGNNVTELMGLRDPTDENPRDWTGLMQNLGPGECLMKDFRGRYCTVQISQYKMNWTDEFETNPVAKAKREQARVSA